MRRKTKFTGAFQFASSPGLGALATMMVAAALLSLSPAVAHSQSQSQHSAAREWNQALLFAIRRDFARPTVHARNLFHISATLFDAWAVYQPDTSTYFLGRLQANGFDCGLTETMREAFQSAANDQVVEQQMIETTMGVAAHRLLRHRFATSPGATESLQRFDEVLDQFGIAYDAADSDLTTGTAVSLGNHLANCVIDYGMSDGANEADGYANRYYEPLNPSLNPDSSANPGLQDPDRWQPLLLGTFIDQSGNPTDTPEFLGPEWGEVLPFALTQTDSVVFNRDGNDYRVYLDPGAPALVATDPASYSWGHGLVAAWSSHLDPADGVEWDISPASIGNIDPLPDTSFQALAEFYNFADGGVEQSGRRLNPATGSEYQQNMVLRGDYTRVLAEFWADGPDSETPPGHWFTMLNEFVLDHPDFERRYQGTGDVLDALEFDVRSYLLLGGAMHDAAITAWSIKGWYDYIRPVSALRYLAGVGQSSDILADNYDPNGIPLLAGTIENVLPGDVLAGNRDVNVGKIKVRAWRGPDFIIDPRVDTAGVGWILLENWWPYQRPTFVTPPFAGYVSGHSTFSRAAAEVLTHLTGDEFFPGGMAEFVAPANDFLVFEQGPSREVRLQWATYRDASDQSSLSRLWGGIHPPVDDIPGRKLGIEVASRAIAMAELFFAGEGADATLFTNGSVASADDGSAVSSSTAGLNSDSSSGGGGGGCSVTGSRSSHADSSLPLLLFLLIAGFFSRRSTQSGPASFSTSRIQRSTIQRA